MTGKALRRAVQHVVDRMTIDPDGAASTLLLEDGVLARLRAALVATREDEEVDTAEGEAGKPYIHVRVAVRLPGRGALEAVFDYDAEAADTGGVELSFKGLTVSSSDMDRDTARRLAQLLEAGAPRLGYEWGRAAKAPIEDDPEA